MIFWVLVRLGEFIPICSQKISRQCQTDRIRKRGMKVPKSLLEKLLVHAGSFFLAFLSRDRFMARSISIL